MDFASPELEPLLLVGAPRSGTTWLQLLLAQHPQVATAHETHVFTWYLRSFFETWRRDRSEAWTDVHLGLGRLLTDDELAAALRAFLGRVFEKIAEGSPGATVVMDKTPEHVRDAADIVRVYPKARFVHIVRDPRAVVASLQAAAPTWGRDWVPDGALGCVDLWIEFVTAGRAIHEYTDRVIEVRYEALHTDGAAELARLFEGIDLPVDAAFCERALEACGIDNLRSGDGPGLRKPWDLDVHPEGFFRRGRADSWRDELSERDREVVEWRAYELMQELGYEPIAQSKPKRPRHVTRWRRRRRLARRLTRLAARLVRRAP